MNGERISLTFEVPSNMTIDEAILAYINRHKKMADVLRCEFANVSAGFQFTVLNEIAEVLREQYPNSIIEFDGYGHKVNDRP